MEAYHTIDIGKATAAGLRSRPLADTVSATLRWYHAWPKDRPFPWRGSLEAEREAQVLAEWHSRG